MRLEQDKVESAQSVSALVVENEKRIKIIAEKLQRLLDGYLDQDIDKETYRAEKAKLLSEKKSLEEEISRSRSKQKHWLISSPPGRGIINTGEPAKLVLESCVFA